MDPVTNPYAPGAGTPPPELAGRDELREVIRIALAMIRASRPAKSILMVGLRGVGGTPDLTRDCGELLEVVRRSLAHSGIGLRKTLALDLTAIGGAMTRYAVFDGLAPYERLTRIVDELGPEAVEAANAHAESMSYDESMQFVFEALDRLIAATAVDG